MGAIIHENANWLNVAQGKLTNKKNNVSLDGWEGRITGIKKRSGDYNGEPKTEVILNMTDGHENVNISFNAESPFARGFFARIEHVDITKPIALGVMPWDDNGTRDKAVSLCFMKQGGIKIEPNKEFPNSQKVKVGNKTVSDWSSMNAATDAIVAKMQAKLGTPVTTEEPELVESEDPLPF